MKIGPFKMKGFSGFKDESPAKHNDNKLGMGGILGSTVKGNNNIHSYGGFASVLGSQAGQALVTKENRKRKGIETGATKKGMGALDMFSGFKNFF